MNKWKGLILGLLTSLVIVATSFAQKNYIITGTCVNNKNIPISYLSVGSNGTENGISRSANALTDATGKFKITYTVTTGIEDVINSNSSTVVSEPFPNPASQSTSFIITTSSRQSIDEKIFDLSGREVLHTSIQPSADQTTITVPLTNFSDGLYVARFTIDGKNYTKKILHLKDSRQNHGPAAGNEDAIGFDSSFELIDPQFFLKR